MWPLIKAEICYYWQSIAILFASYSILTIVVFGWAWEAPERDIPGIGTVGFVALCILAAVRWIRQGTERTDRLLATLPVSRQRVALSRTAFIPLLWTAMLVIFAVVLVTTRAKEIVPGSIWGILSLTGFLFAASSYFLIQRDLALSVQARLPQILLAALFALTTVCGTLVMVFIFGGLQSMSRESFSYRILGRLEPLVPVNLVDLTVSPIGALFFLGLGAVLFALSTAAYQRRRSFLE